MMLSYRYHPRRWSRSRKFEPIGCQPEFPHRTPENLYACPTTAECAPGAPGRMADNTGRMIIAGMPMMPSVLRFSRRYEKSTKDCC